MCSPYTKRMTKLQRWMTANQKDDAAMSRLVRLDRSQISRIRRGVTGASRATAIKLQLITGIRWWHFIETGTRSKTKKG